MQKLIFAIACCCLAGNCFSQDTGIIKVQAATRQLIDSLHLTRVTLAVYPNPAKNKVTLKVNGFEPGIAHVRIMDTRGKQIREDSRLLTSGSEDIIMFLMVPPGIYFIMVSAQGKICRKKLVVL